MFVNNALHCVPWEAVSAWRPKLVWREIWTVSSHGNEVLGSCDQRHFSFVLDRWFGIAERSFRPWKKNPLAPRVHFGTSQILIHKYCISFILFPLPYPILEFLYLYPLSASFIVFPFGNYIAYGPCNFPLSVKTTPHFKPYIEAYQWIIIELLKPSVSPTLFSNSLRSS